jgi:lysophospholipase L1-like esterase
VSARGTVARRYAVIAAIVLVAAWVFVWWFWLRSSEPSVYLSIGDGTQYGCCIDRTKSSPELFRQYLADRMHRDVVWVTTASGYQTSSDFIEGQSAALEPQLDRALRLIEQYRRERRNVVAITLSIGGNDLVHVGEQCPGTQPCLDVYNAALDRLRTNLDTIYKRITEAKDPETPLLVVLYYNASDCGQAGVGSSPTELGVLGWNIAIREVATRHGATLVDLHTPFKGNACRYIVGLDSNEAGHAVIAEAYERSYEAATK